MSYGQQQQQQQKKGIQSVKANGNHSLILTQNGHVYVCGNTHSRYLYANLKDDKFKQLVPVPLDLNDNEIIVDISSGGFHYGAVSNAGRVFLWRDTSLGKCIKTSPTLLALTRASPNARSSSSKCITPSIGSKSAAEANTPCSCLPTAKSTGNLHPFFLKKKKKKKKKKTVTKKI
ncbi:hypothetical protein RFI_06639 [Reticulomyxa filosa]|uniref:Uncharacterized protein n=1 Tax=Reticulomyxa filosa TaxID=46433 RepID=X6NYY2_RETFI|nr:hypothetical protein RFI_06639 [Reticulomyxa filosa]|eukprot:ETO30482.1 hypothetical protein RFI_06639 [Reticulomyxa filosa]